MNRKEKNIEKIQRGPLKIEVIRKDKDLSNENKGKNSKKTKTIFYTALIILLFIALTSAKQTTIKEEYAVQEAGTEQVLKNVIEYYNETTYSEQQVPYVKAICSGDSEQDSPYRYDFHMSVDSLLVENKRVTICAANVTNLENQAGNFTFYVEILRSDGVSTNYLDQKKEVPALNSEVFIWTYDTDVDKSAVCSLKPHTIPKIKRCEIKPEGVSYIKKVAVVTQKARNKTIVEEVPTIISVVKTKERIGYINRLLGYEQTTYFGY